MTQVLTDPKCFEAMDAPDPEEVTCSKAASQAALDLKVTAIELRQLANDLLRMAVRLRDVAAPLELPAPK